MKQLVIRLQRKGRFKKPCYNIVVMFKKSRVHGATLDKIGFYNPIYNNKLCFISLEKLAWWLYKGAVVSLKVQLLIGRLASGLRKGRKVKYYKKKTGIDKLTKTQHYAMVFQKFYK